MTSSHLVPIVAFTLLALVIVIPAVRSKRWETQAEKLARQSDIALPPAVAVRVARRMRTEYLLSMALLIPVWVAYQTVFDRLLDSEHAHRRAVAYSVTAVSLPLVVIALSAILATPRWNAVRERRVTHLVRPSIGQLFTRREWAAVALGVAVAVGAGAWGFWRVDAGPWWVTWPPTLVSGAVAWWFAVKAILTRASRASDDIELGWDDVLRYRQARGLTIGAAWTPAAVLFLIDFGLSDPGSLNLIPFYVVIGGTVALVQIFKEGRGNWRQSWDAGRAQ